MIHAVWDPQYCETAFEDRDIRCVFHDIDGTHSLIRNWPPVMSCVLEDVIVHGLPEGYDSPEHAGELIRRCSEKHMAETDRFCLESAGLSALTQMEWAIRRGVQEGSIRVRHDPDVNAVIIQRIWNGEELSDDLAEPEDMRQLLQKQTPRLFRLYEVVLNGFCRDHNLALARVHPETFRVPGSFEFLNALHARGVVSYFVTGAVVEKGMGMYEEVEALGYSIGSDCMVEAVIGSSWDRKLPKHVIMQELAERLKIPGEQILVVGDGRSEIEAGRKMHALTISRLNRENTAQRMLHRKLGTHMIVPDYYDPALARVLSLDLGGADVNGT